MKRIFPSQFSKSYLSMSKDSLQELYTRISSLQDDTQDARILLTSINSLRFKVNSTRFTIADLKAEALSQLDKKLGTKATVQPLQPLQPLTPTLSPKGAREQVTGSASNRKQVTKPSAAKPTSQTDTNSLAPLGERGGVRGCGDGAAFPSPLITGPLHHEALNVQELYYLPLAQLHNQLFILTQQAIKQAIALGWQGEPVHVPSGSSASVNAPSSSSAWSKCFAPNAERASLQQRILKLDSQLQNFWNRYHLALDEINGTPISAETRAQLDKETRACNSPSLSATVPCDSSQVQKPLGSYTKKEIEAALYPPSLSLEELITARQDRNKKLLRRRDRQKTEAHKATVLEAATELHEWNIYIEPAQAKTCEYYGITLPQDWLRPVPTEEEKKAAHNASQKRSYSKKTALQREMKEAFKAEEQQELFG